MSGVDSLFVSAFVLLLLVLLRPSDCARYRGEWKTGEERVRVIAKFGFQQTKAIDRKATRGFVFGNITSNEFATANRPVLFAIVPQTHYVYFEQKSSSYQSPCSRVMQNLSAVGFESRCFKDGKGDFFRWIPCPVGKLCKDEDDPTIVLPGSQLTMQIEEPTTAQYWYVIMVACDLNPSCHWVESKTAVTVDYDIWLTNGNPSSPLNGPFTLQFSFDEQDTTEMYLLCLVVYVILCVLCFRANTLYRHHHMPPRMKMLCGVIFLKTAGLVLQSLNALVFSVDGEGILIARFFGEIFRMSAVDLLCLLLILISRGWGVTSRSNSASATALTVWVVLTLIDYLFFFCNIMFVYDLPHQVDIFSTWPGYGMLLIRILFALWFLTEIRVLIQSEKNDDKAVFLAHFGAGFLVWFVYILGLGVVASFISPLWRFKVILGIRSLGNTTAIAMLMHIFWPTSTNRKFFEADGRLFTRIRADSAELDAFERLLFDSDESETDERPPPPTDPGSHGL